jgi:Haem-binding domain
MEKQPDQPAVTPSPRKKSWLRRILTILVIIFAGIQFIQPAKDNQSMDMTNDISKVVRVPDTVQALLKAACYDCHSNYTNYPWYSNIQPVGWWLKDHIDEGKRGLNFQEFALVKANEKYPTVAGRQDHKLDEVKEQIEKDEMPLKSYTLIHGEAKLNAAQQKMILTWVDSARAQLTSGAAK